jgi:hypothetical protein
MLSFYNLAGRQFKAQAADTVCGGSTRSLGRTLKIKGPPWQDENDQEEGVDV